MILANGGLGAVGLATFLIVLGLGLSPLPQDSGAVFISRVLDVVFAAVCAIAMASVLRSLSRHSRTGIGSWALG